MNRLIFLIIAALLSLYGKAAYDQQSSRAATAATPITAAAPNTPAAGMTTDAGVSSELSEPSPALAERGGDLESPAQPLQVGQVAPAGGVETPAGALKNTAADFNVAMQVKEPVCQRGPNCQCKTTAALAPPPVPAVPVSAPAMLPVAATYTPFYPTYRPTFSGYVQQGSCGPNCCSPGFRVFRRGR